MPSDSSWLRQLISEGESSLVELKAAWYDLSKPAGKATLAKDVLALANSTPAGATAHLILGVEDPEKGGAILGVASPPSPETISQILADYTTPPPQVTTRHLTVRKKFVSALSIVGSTVRPHHAIRQFAGILEPTVVYIRRDRGNAIATSLEVQDMLLERIGRHGAVLSQTPVRAGFVTQADSSSNRKLVVRVTNVVAVPVSGIEVFVDFVHSSMPSIMARERLLSNLLLQPGESREAEVASGRPSFFHRYFDTADPSQLKVTTIMNFGRHVGDRWLTAVLRVYYRDHEGLLQEIVRKLALDF